MTAAAKVTAIGGGGGAAAAARVTGCAGCGGGAGLLAPARATSSSARTKILKGAKFLCLWSFESLKRTQIKAKL